MTTTIDGIAGLHDLAGQHLGYSDWHTVTQEQVNLFADATGDHQWIHVDPERAKKESPFGGPIAHGYLTLSLVPSLVPVGSRVRARATLEAATPFDGGITMNLGVTMEIEGGTKPAMVATVVYRRYL